MMGGSGIIAVVAVLIVVIRWAWKMTMWLWVNPKRLEKALRNQGLEADPYRFWFGDLIQMVKMQQQAKSLALPNHSHDLAPHVFSFVHYVVNKHGKNSFMWLGPIPRLILMDPALLKDMFNKNYDFVKPDVIPIVNYISTGLASYEGDQWAKHRKIINPAFNLEQLKTLVPIVCQSCNDMMDKWASMLSPTDGTCEVEVSPWLKNLTKEVIARAAFGSSYEEGRQIFDLLTEQCELVMSNVIKHHIPLWRVVPTKENKRMKEIDRNVNVTLENIINKKEEAMKAGEATKSDLLGLLLESSQKEIEEQGDNKKNVGLSRKDVVEECKLFYIAGQETTSALLVWTMMLLSKHPDWQARAREEVLQVFGNQKPDFDALSRLKIEVPAAPLVLHPLLPLNYETLPEYYSFQVTMILYEVLRLYPPIVCTERYVEKDMKIGKLLVPGGVQICVPILMLHHDQQCWGDDAKEFKPDRFSEGLSKASKGTSVAFFPFGGGPRICIGQNFALLEAKLALSLILQRFSFELSPTYSHALTTVLTLQPQHGVQVILHKL